jgi:hypothetical protein
MTDQIPAALIDTAILALFSARRDGATLCPSDIARHIGGEDWRDIMPLIHRHVKARACLGALRLTQKGMTVQPDDLQGVYRIARPAKGLIDKA